MGRRLVVAVKGLRCDDEKCVFGRLVDRGLDSCLDTRAAAVCGGWQNHQENII